MELLNTDLIRRRRLQLRLSQRQLAHHIGVTAPTLARIEDGSNHAELTLETVHQLAGALALDIKELHARPAAEETHDREYDVARVGTALQQEHGLTPLEALAAAFGWTLERTRAAVDQLANVAPTCGLRVHELKREVSLVPAADPTIQQQMEALARSRYARKELNLTEARVITHIIRGADRRQLQGNAQQVALGRLRNAGYVTTDETPCLTDDVAYSLLLDKDQP